MLKNLLNNKDSNNELNIFFIISVIFVLHELPNRDTGELLV